MSTRTVKQKILKKVYPLLMKLSQGIGSKGRILENNAGVQPVTSLFDKTIDLNNGNSVPVSNFRGKKILLVNTASDCGYTEQFGELQQLADLHGEQLVIIGFPANDFKEQERGNDAAIAQFCSVNFGVRFPLARKSSVVKGAQQNPVFAWLSHAAQNGWNNQQPDWNFSKYLVDESGMLTHYFGPAISPLGPEIGKALKG